MVKDEPAFPQNKDPDESWVDTFNPMGLTKREYFAGLAMQGMWTQQWQIAKALDALATNEKLDEVISRMAVDSADALIKELDKDE